MPINRKSLNATGQPPAPKVTDGVLRQRNAVRADDFNSGADSRPPEQAAPSTMHPLIRQPADKLLLVPCHPPPFTAPPSSPETSHTSLIGPPGVSQTTGEVSGQHSQQSSDVGVFDYATDPTTGAEKYTLGQGPPHRTRPGRRQPTENHTAQSERFGAIGPALNYILGLDEYGERRGKSGHAQRLQSPPRAIVGKESAITGEDGRKAMPSVKGSTGTEHLKPAYRGVNYQNSDVDFQRILQSLPPTFPIRQTSGQQSTSTRPPRHPTPPDESKPSAVAPRIAPPKASLGPPPSTSPPRLASTGVSGRDDFLWKLFLPKPTVSHSVQPLTGRFETPYAAAPTTEPEVRLDNFLKREEEKQEIASREEILHPPESRLLIIVRRLPDKIYVLVRRRTIGDEAREALGEPLEDEHKIRRDGFATFKLDPNLPIGSTQDEFGEVTDTKCWNLDLADADNATWLVDRNEFGLEFAPAFPRDINKIVVADPDISFTHLSRDVAVQQKLRETLSVHLTQRGIIPVFVDEHPAAWNEKYSEEVLAPIFHYRTPPVSTGFHFLDWTGYLELNKAFLNSILPHYRQGDWLLVLNYQLMMLPKMLRESHLTRDANIGFYLGSVFPSSEMYRIIPQREELLRGVLAATFIGFHGFQYKRHFLTACTRVLGVECSGDRIEPNAAVGGGAGAKVVTVPRGINPFPWLKELRKPKTKAKIAELRAKFRGKKVLLGIDTVDYTKGVPNKMLGFQQFLNEYPKWTNKVVMIQMCIPKGPGGYQESTGFDLNGRISRVDRREILANLFQLVGGLNASYGNVADQPVHFLTCSLSVEHLVCLYELADIAVITPLRESLSWTAYEFVLCQSISNRGVLILSEFSGSAQSLGAAAICVNPWDPHAVATAINDALEMSEAEKWERHEYAYDYVLNYDAAGWGTTLMEEFRSAVADVEAERRTIPPKLDIDSLKNAFQSTTTHVYILGLRGSLIPYSGRGVDPQLVGRAKLPKHTEMALQALSLDPNTHILVLSSSPCTVLAQAVAHFSNITIMAENGHFVRPSADLISRSFTRSTGSAECVTVGQMSSPQLPKRSTSRSRLTDFIQTTNSIDLSWMDPVEEICRYFEQRTPGSYLYRTDTGVTWNYRGAQREHGASQARDLLIHLWAGPVTLTARTDIVVGPHSVEVRSSAMNKAVAVERWLRDLEDQQVVLTNSMIFCAANSLPRDEDVFTTILKCLEISSIDETELSIKKDSESRPAPPQFQKVMTCTIGLKPSRADYLISDEKELESILTLLAALSVLQQHRTADPASSTAMIPFFFPAAAIKSSQDKKSHISIPLGGRALRLRSPPNRPSQKQARQRHDLGVVALQAASAELRRQAVVSMDLENVVSSAELQRALVASWYSQTHAHLSEHHSSATIRKVNPKVSRPPLDLYAPICDEESRRKSAPPELSVLSVATEYDTEAGDLKSIGAADDEESGGNEDEEEEEEFRDNVIKSYEAFP